MVDKPKQKYYSPWLEDDSKQYITGFTDPQPRKIVTAANRHRETGLIIVGSRHWSEAMRAQIRAAGIEGTNFEQGFIDQYDQFLNRKDAKRIALKNGQELIGEDWGDELYSENLH